jgi:hypothetical protein
MSMGIQTVRFKCPCGKTHELEMDHYDRVILSCKTPVWAIQPTRNGPYEVRLWPGPNLTRAEMLRKYGPDKDE